MGFLNILTGRNEKEADVYANFDKVSIVVENIKKIGSNEVENARSSVHDAMDKLNNVNGVAQYVGNVNVSEFDKVFDNIAQLITQIGDQLEAKANDIKTYSESKWYEKAASTVLMSGAKLGEGLLSVAEDLGDGAVSLVGWVAPKDSGVEKWCEKFVENEWSHDAFNGYYNSELAKKSAFTEDSMIAGAFKITGSAVGYMALGGAISGAGGALAATSNASKVGTVAKAVGTFTSSTTRTNTVLAALGGMGTGTEAGLKTGLDFDQAALKGVKQAAVQGGIAYGAGKLGELGQKRAAVQEAEKEVNHATTEYFKAEKTFNTADDALNTAEKSLNAADKAYDDAYKAADDAVKAMDNAKKASITAKNNLSDAIAENDAVKITNAQNDVSSTSKEVTKAFDTFQKTSSDLSKAETARKIASDNFDDALATATDARIAYNKADKAKMIAQGAYDKAYNAKLSDFQGYSDVITKSAQKVGNKGMQNVIDNGIVKGTAANAASVLKSGKNAVASGVSSATSGIKGFNPVQSVKGAVSNAGNAIKNAPKNIPSTVKSIRGNVANAAKAITSSSASAGVAAQAGNAVGRELVTSSANGQFKKNQTNISKPENTVKLNENVDYSVGRDSSEEVFKSTGDGNGNNNYDENYSGGGYSGGGNSGGNGGDNDNSSKKKYKDDPTTEKKKEDPKPDKKTEESTPDKKTEDPTPDKKTENQTPDKKTEDPIHSVDPSKENPSDAKTSTENISSNATQQQQQQTNGITPSNNETNESNSQNYTQHSGGGYSESGGYTSSSDDEGYIDGELNSDGEQTSDITEVADALEDSASSIDDVIKGNKYTKIPTSSSSLPPTTSHGSGSAVIPIAAGLSAAAAAGIGAKAYMDRKRNNDNGEDDIYTDEWDGDENVDISYDESTDSDDNYLSEEDDYSYQTQETEKYDARNNEELVDLQ